MSTGGGRASGGKQVGTRPVVVKKHEIHFVLTDDEIAQAEACLRNSGEVKITFSEIKVTHLPAVLDNGRQID